MRPFVFAALGFAAALTVRATILDPQAAARREQRLGENVLLSPGVPVLEIATMEHPHGWADIVWLGIVQELARPFDGGEAAWDRTIGLGEIATDLDRKYLTVYHSTAIHLSVFAKRVEASDRLLQKGWKNLPGAWQLPFVLGYNAYFLRGEPGLASDWFLKASREAGAPRFLPALAGRLRHQAGDEQGAIALLEILVEQLEGPAREDAMYRLIALKSEARLRLFDEACERYRQERGELPKSGEMLKRLGYVDAPPNDLFGASVEFLEEAGCTAVTDKIKFRESQAKERLRNKAPSDAEARTGTVTATTTKGNQTGHDDD